MYGGKVLVPGARRRGGMCSPNALYARPLALRELYLDAGSLIRREQRKAAAEAANEQAAASQENSR